MPFYGDSLSHFGCERHKNVLPQNVKSSPNIDSATRIDYLFFDINYYSMIKLLLYTLYRNSELDKKSVPCIFLGPT